MLGALGEVVVLLLLHHMDDILVSFLELLSHGIAVTHDGIRHDTTRDEFHASTVTTTQVLGIAQYAKRYVVGRE